VIRALLAGLCDPLFLITFAMVILMLAAA